jgi:alpha-tubulin suppressor-like RCC1 family protein
MWQSTSRLLFCAVLGANLGCGRTECISSGGGADVDPSGHSFGSGGAASGPTSPSEDATAAVDATGTGATGNVPSPADATTPEGPPPPVARSIAAAGDRSCAVTSSGQVLCWGEYFDGQQVTDHMGATRVPVAISGITDAVAVSCADNAACASLGSGKVQCWGNNSDGVLGNGTTTEVDGPVEVSGIDSAVGVAVGPNYGCAVLSSGAIRCWGNNSAGTLGDGTTTNRLAPVAVSGISTAIAVSVGTGHACALLKSGNLRCWGENSYGQLGNGTKTNSLVPVTVAGIRNATAVGVADSFACATQTSAFVQCWGRTDPCALIDDLTPVVVRFDVVSMAVGHTQVYAVKASGNMIFWGKSVEWSGCSMGPVAGIAEASSTAVGRRHACALLRSGAVQCWGDNQVGQLGDGTYHDSEAPVTVIGF